MLRTKITELFSIDYPILLAGMAGVVSREFVAAASNSGGLGILGCTRMNPAKVSSLVFQIREKTERPFGLNVLLCQAHELLISVILDARPAVLSTAWAYPEYDLRGLFNRVHAHGIRVLHMVSTVDDATRAAEAGADVIVAQGSEGGGHTGLIGAMVFVRQVVKLVQPIPVVAAGGIVDGAGVAAALALGADGVMAGTRFLATEEAPISDTYKQWILTSDGQNTLLTDIVDLARGFVWPGALARVFRNRLIEEWIGREAELKRRRAEIASRIGHATSEEDDNYTILFGGQGAGLIDSIKPVGVVIHEMASEAESIIRQSMQLISPSTPS